LQLELEAFDRSCNFRSRQAVRSCVRRRGWPSRPREGLGIRQDGVDRHVNDILTKIGAVNRTEAVAIALRKLLLKI